MEVTEPFDPSDGEVAAGLTLSQYLGEGCQRRRAECSEKGRQMLIPVEASLIRDAEAREDLL
jgi:hypothetical protein